MLQIGVPHARDFKSRAETPNVPFFLVESLMGQFRDQRAHRPQDLLRVELTDRQQEAYDRAETDGVVKLNKNGDTITVQHVFALIQKLMQVCNFDAESGKSAKLARLAEDLEEIVDSGRKALVFSQFVSTPFGLKQIALTLPDQCESAAHE